MKLKGIVSKSLSGEGSLVWGKVARHAKHATAELVRGPTVRIRRSSIPRFLHVMDNLESSHWRDRRTEVLFEDKFSNPGEMKKRMYSIADDEVPVRDPAVILPPSHIYARGHLPFYSTLMSDPYICGGPLHMAIVGPIGPRVNANLLAEGLAEAAVREVDAVIVSGFAEGIDKHAHLGALNAFGPTIAFLPHGLANRRYYTDTSLLKYAVPLLGGGFVSEYSRTSLMRDGSLQIEMPNGRLHSADENKMLLLRDGRTTSLADIVVVVEAAKRSGSEDTGRRAHLQGIPVFAVDWRMVNLKFDHPGLPDVINGGLKRLVNEGCAISFPPREWRHKVELEDLPRLFLHYILDKLEEMKAG